MPLRYDIGIEPAEQAGHFILTWRDAENETIDSFPQTLPAGLSNILELWQLHLHQAEIGEHLFAFLNGKAAHLEKTLDRAENQADTLQINLWTCDETADWPFECLALNGEFLLHNRLHLVRKASHTSPVQTGFLRTGPLKLLFMACSAIDVKPELDFDQEEEAIFNIAETLSIDVDIEDSGSLAGLRDRLKNETYDLIYLSGFSGVDEHHNPYFVMEDEFGFECHVGPDQLWQDALIEAPPRLLFLSGSNTGKSTSKADSSFARSMVESGRLPAALGWGYEVIDEPAICAVKMLFRELNRGRTILDAVQRTRYELVKKFPFRGQGTWAFLRLYGEKHPQTAISLNNVGETLKRMAYAKKAIGDFLLALSIKREINGNEHTTIAGD